VERKLALMAISIVISYAVYNAYIKKETNTQIMISKQYTKEKSHSIQELRDELNQMDTVEYTKKYIIDVINHGSNQLSFKGGVMEGGYLPADDAPSAACFVLTLSGKTDIDTCFKESQIFYSSVCGGCHGDDGKGLDGTYPDLTKNKLLGIAKREEWLTNKIKEKNK